MMTNVPKEEICSKSELSELEKKFDVDGDGVLDAAEQQMLALDVEQKGYLDLKQVYDIIDKKMSVEKQASQLKIWVTALAVAVILLAASNIGTAYLAVKLNKDMETNAEGVLTTTSSDHTIVSTHGIGSSVGIVWRHDETYGVYACISQAQNGIVWKNINSGSNIALSGTYEDSDDLNSIGLVPGKGSHNQTHTCYFQSSNDQAICVYHEISPNPCLVQEEEDGSDSGLRRRLRRAYMVHDNEKDWPADLKEHLHERRRLNRVSFFRDFIQ